MKKPTFTDISSPMLKSITTFNLLADAACFASSFLCFVKLILPGVSEMSANESLRNRVEDFGKTSFHRTSSWCCARSANFLCSRFCCRMAFFCAFFDIGRLQAASDDGIWSSQKERRPVRLGRQFSASVLPVPIDGRQTGRIH